jgi:hypothetical protein
MLAATTFSDLRVEIAVFLHDLFHRLVVAQLDEQGADAIDRTRKHPNRQAP